MTALDEQVGGSHYRDMAMQPWVFNIINKLPPTEAHIVEYICRWRKKGGILDLEKIQQYCQMLIDHERIVEDIKSTNVCDGCFDKHLLAKTLGFEFLKCVCKCHNDKNGEYKNRGCDNYKKQEFCCECPYNQCPNFGCECKCHKETKDNNLDLIYRCLDCNQFHSSNTESCPT